MEKFTSKKTILTKALKADGERVSGIMLYYDEATDTKYFYTGEGHICILGVPGSGKSSTMSINYAENIIRKKESGIFVDSKTEIYENTISSAKKTHEVYVLNFREPEHSNSFNPLLEAYKLWKKGGSSRDKANRKLYEIASVLFPFAKGEDPFWSESARDVFVGISLSLFEFAFDPRQINFRSIFEIFSKGEQKFGCTKALNELLNILPEDSYARILLNGYVNSPNDTHMSTHSVFSAGLKHLISSELVTKLFSGDDISLEKISGDKPIAIYILLPDESDVYGKLTAIIIDLLTTHFISLAEEKYHGALPIKAHILIEELGNIGAIPNLTMLLGSSRSRNMKICTVLQSYAQLDAVYGDAAHAIKDCFDVIIAYRISALDTLKELSEKCGTRSKMYRNTLIYEPLITPSSLGALQTRQCLIMVEGKYKYITFLPFYSDIYGEKTDKNLSFPLLNSQYKVFPFLDIINTAREAKQEKMMQDMSLPTGMFGNVPTKPMSQFDIDQMVAKIDKKIAELEELERQEEEKSRNNRLADEDIDEDEDEGDSDDWI